MKTYISLLLIVGGLVVIVVGGYFFMKHTGTKNTDIAKTTINTRAVTGEVIRNFEGENKLRYVFNVPEAARGGACAYYRSNYDTRVYVF